MDTSTESASPQMPVKNGGSTGKSFARAATWTVGLAAAILVMISVGGYFYHREQLAALATEHLRLIVTGPAALQAGVPAEYTISTSAISGQPLPSQVEVTLLTPEGKRLKAYKETTDERGRLQVAIPGELSLPPQVKLRVVALHYDSREEMETPLAVDPVRQEKQTSFIRQHRLPRLKKKLEPVLDIEPGKVEVVFYPEGGNLVAGLENRVYFAGRNPLGKPVHLRGAIVANGDTETTKEEVCTVETLHEGMGVFTLAPRDGSSYRLKITSPAGVKSETKLPAVSKERKVLLTTGPGVFAPAAPLEFKVWAAKPGLPLVAAAYCRGVQVGQQPLVTKSGANGVAIPLDAAVDGVVWLTVYDYSTSPPLPAAERLVYRRPAHKLNIRVTGHSKRYSPGENVSLSLLVTNEKGEPVPATLGVAVVDDAMCTLADDRFYLSEGSKGDVPAAVALDLLLGTQGWRRLAKKSDTKPPFMFDNIGQIREDYERRLAEYRADRTKALNTITTASFFGGLGLVLLVAMLGLMRIVFGMHLWIPAIGATTCCLIMGAILLDPGRLTPGQDVAVAFLSYCAPPPDSQKADPEKPNINEAEDEIALDLAEAKPGVQNDFAETLFWNPLLIAGPNGKASISFKLSETATTFRVLIDAQGDGRTGSGQVELISRTP